MTRSHHRTEQIGLRLVHHIAPAVVVAIDLYQYKRDVADGMKARGETAERGISDNSTTEAAILEAEKWELKVNQIMAKIAQVEVVVGQLAALTIGIDRTPAAGEEKRCADGQRLYGRVLAWSNNDQCPELPIKMGLCNTHYQAFYRWRTAHHLPVAQYFETSDNDVR